MRALGFGFWLVFGVFGAILTLAVIGELLGGVVRLLEWFVGRSRQCYAETHTEKCVLRQGHFGNHATAVQTRPNGTRYRTRFHGTRWSGSSISWGEEVR